MLAGLTYMLIREGTEADLLAFAAVFRDAIQVAGPARYTPDQVAAWAASAEDGAAFGRRMLETRTFVAEDESGLVGFASLDPDGRVGMLYVRGDGQRRGVGGRLLATALEAAAGSERSYAEASAISLPVFLRAGFEVVGTETVRRQGVSFERHLVERALEPAG